MTNATPNPETNQPTYGKAARVTSHDERREVRESGLCARPPVDFALPLAGPTGKLSNGRPNHASENQ